MSGQRKTETIKERTVYVYLPSEEFLEEWRRYAEASGKSLSKFVFEVVEDYIRKTEDKGFESRLELIKKLRSLEEETKQLRDENRMLRMLVKNLEKELRKYRAQPFLEPSFEGIRRFDRELIELLRSGETFSEEEILDRLGVDPSETDYVKAISKQLEILEQYGLVEFTGRGWRWRG
jgi:predicted RNase H-like nuclease (RuvC/YqgF family)